MNSSSKDPRKKTLNDWADFWRYTIGVNVIPVNTKERNGYVKWSEWQDKAITEIQHEEWKKKNAFEIGMAIMPGRVWHRADINDLYLIFIDLDSQKAIDEFCKVQGLVGESSFSIVLPKSYALNLGISKGEFLKVTCQNKKIIIEKSM